MTDKIETGQEIREQYLGAGGARAFAPIGELSPKMRRWVVGELFGDVYADDTLDLRTRSLCTISTLLALHRVGPLRNHVRGALANGVTKAELVALFEQSLFYLGLPTAATGFKVLAEVLAEEAAET
jgi:4-carboxymuconolactone decarboxylase